MVGVQSEEVLQREVVGVAVAREHCEGLSQCELSVAVSVDEGEGAVLVVREEASFYLEV